MANNLMADGIISLDDRPAQEAVKRTNAALDGHEQKVKTILDRTGREWQVAGDLIVRVTDRSKNSLDRLLRSMERQSELLGKSGVEREIAQRDQLLRRWQNEQAAVDAINKLYEKRIALARATEAAEGAADGGSGFNARYAFFGIKDVMEGRTKFALAEAANELMRLKGSALILGGVTAGVAAIGFAAYETYKHLQEMAEQPRKIAVAFQDLNGAVEANADQLRQENDRLANTIAKLEHKPQNLLAEALDDARLAADRLAESLDKDIEKAAEVIKANHVGWFDRNVMGVAGTGDIENWYKAYQAATKQVNYAGKENVRQRDDQGRRRAGAGRMEPCDCRASKVGPGATWGLDHRRGKAAHRRPGYDLGTGRPPRGARSPPSDASGAQGQHHDRRRCGQADGAAAETEGDRTGAPSRQGGSSRHVDVRGVLPEVFGDSR